MWRTKLDRADGAAYTLGEKGAYVRRFLGIEEMVIHRQAFHTSPPIQLGDIGEGLIVSPATAAAQEPGRGARWDARRLSGVGG